MQQHSLPRKPPHASLGPEFLIQKHRQVSPFDPEIRKRRRLLQDLDEESATDSSISWNFMKKKSWIFRSRKSLFEWAARAAGLRRLGWLAPKHQTAVTGQCWMCWWGEPIKRTASPDWGCSTVQLLKDLLLKSDNVE